MMQTAIWLALVSMFCMGTSWFLMGRVVKKQDPVESLWVIQVLGWGLLSVGLPVGPIAVGWQTGLKIVGLGVYLAFVLALMFYAMKVGTLGVVYPISDGYVVFTAVAGVVLLGEGLSLGRMAALACVVVGIVLLSTKLTWDKLGKIARLEAGAKPALVASMGFGLMFVLATMLVRDVGWWQTTYWMRVGTSVGALALLIWKRIPVARVFQRVEWRLVVPAASLDVLGSILYNVAVTSAPVSVVTAINSTQSLVVVGLGYFILKERIRRYQWVGLGLIVTGLVWLTG